MLFELKPLPYEYDALEPFISKRTLEIHHTKHHGGYVEKLEQALQGDAMKDVSLETILLNTSGKRFNLAAQIWNHEFYWESLTPSPVALDALVLDADRDQARVDRGADPEAVARRSPMPPEGQPRLTEAALSGSSSPKHFW